MECERDVLVSPTTEVPVIEGEVVTAIRTLAGRGVGKKAIAREVGVAVNTVRRYLRQPITAGQQVRPAARRLTDDRREEARTLYEGPAAGNAVVVQRLLAERGCAISVRTIERAVADIRRAQRVAALATVRVETAPGDQLQIDFGQKRLRIAGVRVRIFLLVAVLSYSRRLFVKAFLNERGDDWREGIAAAFTHFGGVPRTLLGDNARALVLGRDRATGTVSFHPAYLAFCRDWDVQPRACAPYRARTKGKTEAGVKYVKRNALADQAFDSFGALEQHLADVDDARRSAAPRHDARSADRALRARRARGPAAVAAPRAAAADAAPAPSRRARCLRRRRHDPVQRARIDWCATMSRSSSRISASGSFTAPSWSRRTPDRTEPFARVVDIAHYAGLWRSALDDASRPRAWRVLGRDLADYAAVVDGGQ